MKSIFKTTLYFLVLLITLVSCHDAKKETIDNTLYKLDIIDSENFVRITIPEGADFSFPDEAAKKEPYEHEDFNSDGKADVLVYLGACGTGGCMYGLFLNQHDNYYSLAFMDYLKGAEFEKDTDGFLIVKSFEEIEPYNPSKLNVSVYKFDKNDNEYKLDSTYVQED